MANLARLFWETAPRDLVRKVARRVRRVTKLEASDLLRSPRYLRAQMPYDFLSRYETILARTHGWRPLDFEGRVVLEIGCGPLLGFGPLAIFLGCKSFIAIDPAADPSLFDHPGIREAYVLRLHKDLSGVYGAQVSYDDFLRRLKDRVRVCSASILDVDIGPGPAEIVLSNSTLEHLDPLEACVRRLRELSRPDARFLHLVDFGNHRPTPSPFADMYAMVPDEYRRKFGRGINLARAPDLLRLMRESGCAAGLAPYYSFPELFEGPVAPYWRESYSDEDLFLKAAILFGPATK